MGATKVVENGISQAKPIHVTIDRAKLPPPKNFEKYEKFMTAMLEENKIKTKVTKEDIPEEVVEYVQRLFDPNFQPEGFENWPPQDQQAWMNEYGVRYFGQLPKSLAPLATAICRPGDNGRPIDELPEGLDVEKFRRGQKFALDNFFGLSLNIVLSFFAVYTFKDGLRTLIFTKKSCTPYNAFFRYLKNFEAAWHWYTTLPWEKGTEGYKTLEATRRIHQAAMKVVRRKTATEMNAASKIKCPWSPTRELLVEDFRESCTRENVLERPYVLLDGLPNRPKDFNQADMTVTLFGFTGLPVLYPEFFGIRNAKDEDLEAFCYVWKTMGYMLGIEDEFNMCSGSIEEIRQRSKDIVEYWIKPNMKEVGPEWEHLTRCMAEGVGYFIPLVPYLGIVCLLSRAFNMSTPRLEAALDWPSWLVCKLYMFYINYLVMIPGMVYILNKLLIYLMKIALAYSPEKVAKLKEVSDQTILKNSIVL